MPSDSSAMIEAVGLAKHYRIKRGLFAAGVVKAVDGIDLKVRHGSAFGIVGESGSGKSTIAKLLLRLTAPSAGQIIFDGRDITHLAGEELRLLRREMQIVFQNPHSALNARHTIFDAIAEPLVVQDGMRGPALRKRVEQLLDTVGLPKLFLCRYPHELSGGQKQRVCIARAVSLNPKLVILDEPTSALDVSVQAQILAFLKELRTELNLTYIFISHNLAVVRYLCDSVAVMYLGRIVEQGETKTVFSTPQHPYTEALLAAVPRYGADRSLPRLLEGDIPSPSKIPGGCRFHPRCACRQSPLCDITDPQLLPVAAGHAVACLVRQALAK